VLSVKFTRPAFSCDILWWIMYHDVIFQNQELYTNVVSFSKYASHVNQMKKKKLYETD